MDLSETTTTGSVIFGDGVLPRVWRRCSPDSPERFTLVP